MQGLNTLNVFLLLVGGGGGGLQVHAVLRENHTKG